MLFKSKHANFQAVIRPERYKYHPTTGDVIETVPAIWANFGTFGDQYTFTNPETGETMQGAHISGFAYDTDEEAAKNGWDQETKEFVERTLLKISAREPERVWMVQRETPKAPLPWPSYDSLDADQILELAPQLGQVDAVLAYERENRQRPAILDGLTADAVDVEPDVEPVEPGPQVDVAKAAEMLGAGKVADPSLRTITV